MCPLELLIALKDGGYELIVKVGFCEDAPRPQTFTESRNFYILIARERNSKNIRFRTGGWKVSSHELWFKTAIVGHVQIQQDHVRMQIPSQGNGGFETIGLAHDLDGRFPRQDFSDCVPNDFGIICNENGVGH